MARHSKVVTITTEGRDKGKTFVVQEVSAFRAEKWAARAFLALARSGIDIPQEVMNAGMAGIAVIGLRAIGGVYFAEVEPLLDEMLTTIQIIPDLRRPEVMRAVREDQNDIEEVSTLFQLRRECAELHLGFSLGSANSETPTSISSSTTTPSQD